MNTNKTLVIGAGAVVSLLAMGCIDYDSKEWTSCLKVGCPQISCTTTYTVSQDDLVACYGWNSDTGDWGGNAPSILSSSCDNTPATDCVVAFRMGVDADPVCEWGNAYDIVGGADCGWPDADPGDGIDFANQLSRDCKITATSARSCDVLDPATLAGVALTTSCDTSCDDPEGASRVRTARPPGTTTTLALDPAHSFLAVTTPLQSVSVPLSGSGFVNLSSGQLLGVMISADGVRFGATDFSGWSFTLAKPVPIIRAGEAFRVPAAQQPTVIGTGRRNGQQSKLRIVPSADMTGHLRVGPGTWDLDFADQNVAGGFAMHLVGRVTP